MKTLPPTETQGLRNEIELAVGAIYMLTVNIDVSDGLTNGCTGELKEIVLGRNPQTKVTRPVRLMFDFKDSKVGSKARQTNHNSTFTPISVEKKKIKSWPARHCTA